jgi:hypothetical protein
MAGLVIFKPGRLAEAAVIIGEGDTPEEAGMLDARKENSPRQFPWS